MSPALKDNKKAGIPNHSVDPYYTRSGRKTKRQNYKFDGEPTYKGLGKNHIIRPPKVQSPRPSKINVQCPVSGNSTHVGHSGAPLVKTRGTSLSSVPRGQPSSGTLISSPLRNSWDFLSMPLPSASNNAEQLQVLIDQEREMTNTLCQPTTSMPNANITPISSLEGRDRNGTASSTGIHPNQKFVDSEAVVEQKACILNSTATETNSTESDGGSFTLYNNILTRRKVPPITHHVAGVILNQMLACKSNELDPCEKQVLENIGGLNIYGEMRMSLNSSPASPSKSKTLINMGLKWFLSGERSPTTKSHVEVFLLCLPDDTTHQKGVTWKAVVRCGFRVISLEDNAPLYGKQEVELEICNKNPRILLTTHHIEDRVNVQVYLTIVYKDDWSITYLSSLLFQDMIVDAFIRAHVWIGTESTAVDVHMLCKASSYFDRAFKYNNTLNTFADVCLPTHIDCTMPIFKKLLLIINPGVPYDLSLNDADVLKVAYLADIFGIPDLKCKLSVIFKEAQERYYNNSKWLNSAFENGLTMVQKWLLSDIDHAALTDMANAPGLLPDVRDILEDAMSDGSNIIDVID